MSGRKVDQIFLACEALFDKNQIRADQRGAFRRKRSGGQAGVMKRADRLLERWDAMIFRQIVDDHNP